MSLDRCKTCHRFVDTDLYPECYGEIDDPNPQCICENCREDAWVRQQESNLQDPPETLNETLKKARGVR